MNIEKAIEEMKSLSPSENAIEVVLSELNNLKKIIDEMALAIASYDIDEEICKNQVKVFCDNEPLGVTADVCAKCIKQYFEKKVEGK